MVIIVVATIYINTNGRWSELECLSIACPFPNSVFYRFAPSYFSSIIALPTTPLMLISTVSVLFSIQNELGIKIVNGREAEAIAHQPGDSDSDEDRKPRFKNSTSSKGGSTHEYRSGGVGAKDGGRLTASSRHHTRPDEKTLDPLKNILQSM